MGRLTSRDAGVWPGHLSLGWMSPKDQLSSTLPVGLVEVPWALLTVVLPPCPPPVHSQDTSGAPPNTLFTRLHCRVCSLEGEPTKATGRGFRESARGVLRAPHVRGVTPALTFSNFFQQARRVETLIQFIDERAGAQRGLETCPKCPSEEW